MKIPGSQGQNIPLRTALVLALAGCLLFSLVSITLMESFLALAFLAWIILIIKGQEKFSVPGFFWPLLAYAGLSLLACAFSVNPAFSFKDARELLLYLAIPITMAAASSPRARDLMTNGLLVSGFLSVLYSLGYDFLKAQPGERIQGFMGHYMTQAGLLMLFLCAALSLSLFSSGRTRWLWAASVPLAGWCLALTLTRSAWIGLVAASALILALYKPKTLLLIPIVAGFFLAFSPQPMKRRALSIFSPGNYGNQLRIQYWRAGVKIVAEKPLLGTGPDTVDMVFQDPRYGLSGEARSNVHLHNNIIQIAAERGIPTLLAWLAFIAWCFFSLIGFLKKRDPAVFPLAASAGASLLALFTAGLFEYNFADSEITVLFLFLITVPYAASKAART